MKQKELILHLMLLAFFILFATIGACAEGHTKYDTEKPGDATRFKNSYWYYFDRNSLEESTINIKEIPCWKTYITDGFQFTDNQQGFIHYDNPDADIDLPYVAVLPELWPLLADEEDILDENGNSRLVIDIYYLDQEVAERTGYEKVTFLNLLQ